MGVFVFDVVGFGELFVIDFCDLLMFEIFCCICEGNVGWKVWLVYNVWLWFIILVVWNECVEFKELLKICCDGGVMEWWLLIVVMFG